MTRLLSRRSGGTSLAVDLGTGRTQLSAPGVHVEVDEPTVLAYDGDTPVVAGRAAWDEASRRNVRLSYPVRRASVIDPVGAVHVLQLLMRDAGIRGPVSTVTFALPGLGSDYDARLLAAVVESGTGGHAVPVHSALAAAIGCGQDVDEPVLVCDVGVGISEVAIVSAGCVRAVHLVQLGIRDYLDDPPVLLAALVDSVRVVLDRVPDLLAGDIAARPLWLVGGGAYAPALSDDLAAACRLDVRIPAVPRDAVLQGLVRCLDGHSAVA